MNNNPLLPQPHIKGLIFDLDGTLADTMPIHLKAWSAAGQLYGVDITDKMINDRAGTPTIQVIEQLNELNNWTIDPTEFRWKKNELYLSIKEQAGKVQPIDAVVEIARKYKGVLPMAVGTGSIRSNALSALNDLGITDWFETVVTADDVALHKPHPDTFLEGAKAIGISPKDCLVYEDGPMGIEAALAGGMSVVNIETLEIFHP